MSNEAAHAFMPAHVHALVSGVIRLSDRHPTLGTPAVMRHWPSDGLCLDSGVKSWGTASSHDVK